MSVAAHPDDRQAAWRVAFRAMDFDWTCHLLSVWRDVPHHSELLNGDVAEEIVDSLFQRDAGPASNSPEGELILGPAGSGKTHLVAQLRRRMWEKKGWFILFDLLDANDFWETASLSYLQSLGQSFEGGITQGDEVFLRLCTLPDIGTAIKSQASEIFSSEKEAGEKLARIVNNALHASHRPEAMQFNRIVRAFILLQMRDPETSDPAYNWLQGIEVEGSGLGPCQTPRQIVKGISWLMSLSAPTVVAIDQLDGIVAMHDQLAGQADDETDEAQRKARGLLVGLGGGLRDLHTTTRRTKIVVSALERTWPILIGHTLTSSLAFFAAARVLTPLNSRAAAGELVVNRMAPAYETTGFNPPYPSWPFKPESFTTAVDFLPRLLLQRADAHVRRCLRDGQVTELETFDEAVSPPVRGRTGADFGPRLLSLKEQVEPPTDFDGKAFSDVLVGALRCLQLQTEVNDDTDLAVDCDPHRRKPALNARFRVMHRAQNELERHWCFRAIPHANAVAFQSRLKAAMTASGIDHALPFRHLVILRNDPKPGGPVTARLFDQFSRAGGQVSALTEDELRTMAALARLADEASDGLEAWLKSTKPLCQIRMFRDAGLCDLKLAESPGESQGNPVPPPPPNGPGNLVNRPPGESRNGQETSGVREEAATVTESEDETGYKTQITDRFDPHTIPVGRALVAGKAQKEMSLPLSQLAKHAFIVAGSGSGKTVLLRRIVEEAALRGVPSIVIDVNNDLARLGDHWPKRPDAWSDDDAASAQRYENSIETIVWTPNLKSGRPVVLKPLPDFAVAKGQLDEFEQTIDMAHGSVLPLVGASGVSGKLMAGVLKDALRSFAEGGGGQLEELAAYLSDLPPDVSRISGAEKLAAKMADQIHAAMATNPLLGGKGAPLDPRDLLTASSPDKTRISVLNLSGLAMDEAKQAFVNQLQMTLFAWIKQNPAEPGRLRGLLVLDEAQNFAPSGKSTPSLASTLALVSQARKYGLGMIFATQAPKGIDNKIVSNSATHFYGLMNAPATIDAVQDMMKAKGGGGSDIGAMKTGEFYFATEGLSRPIKIKAPLCLSYHAGALTQDEVVARARATFPKA